MTKRFENKINKILNKVVKQNNMINCNFHMTFRILNKKESLKETFIKYKMKQLNNNLITHSTNTTYEITKLLTEFIEIAEIKYKDLFYSPLDYTESCNMKFFSSWFYINDGETVLNQISPLRNEILNLLYEYTSNFNTKYYTIKEEPSQLISGNFFSTGYHLFVCLENEILMFEFTMFD